MRPKPPDRRHPGRGPRPPRAFTLIELLVVISIIAVLVTLLIAVIPRMQLASKRTTSLQAITIIQGAIDRYYTDFRSYPGPLAEADLIAGTNAPANVGGTGRPTASENLVLGLLGGLYKSGAAHAYDPARLYAGAVNTSTAVGSTPKSYLERNVAGKMLSAGGAAFADEQNVAANDSAIPEFIDAFDNPIPILYLRARQGNFGVVSDATIPGPTKAQYQYDVRQVLAYTGTGIGLQQGKVHGLQSLGNSTAIPKLEADPVTPPYDALTYLRQPGSGTVNATGTPRQKDRYILIGAGVDRTYGTDDDLTSFGDVR